ncbi:MAG: hypothetical protein J07HX5_00865 [halophilic archaeon J07HX5]|nr:MAG: hypothetical protein J07HX5_00865 [halophilic archaeon J07HX5]
MGNKTDDLRELFQSVTGTDAVTDRQQTVGESGGDTAAQLATLIDRMREQYAFETNLSTGTYEEIVRLYHDGLTDQQIGTATSQPADTVASARLDLHLVREADLNPAAETAVDVDAAVDAQQRSQRASRRFRTAFASVVTDTDLSKQLTADAHEDALEDVTDDAEVGVDL